MMLSKRQEAVVKFWQSADRLKEISQNWPDASLGQFTEVIVNACALFGETEFYAREAERCLILGIQRERANFCNLMVQARNADGLGVLGEGPNILPLLKIQLESFPVNITEDQKKQLKEFSIHFAEVSVDSLLKPADVGKIQKVVDEVVSVGVNKGASGVVSILETKTEELQKARRRSDRGTFDNVPYWKYVAVALFIGVAVIAVIHCFIFRACSAISVFS